jgi:hypothetical protein
LGIQRKCNITPNRAAFEGFRPSLRRVPDISFWNTIDF